VEPALAWLFYTAHVMFGKDLTFGFFRVRTFHHRFLNSGRDPDCDLERDDQGVVDSGVVI